LKEVEQRCEQRRRRRRTTTGKKMKTTNRRLLLEQVQSPAAEAAVLLFKLFDPACWTRCLPPHLFSVELELDLAAHFPSKRLGRCHDSSIDFSNSGDAELACSFFFGIKLNDDDA